MNKIIKLLLISSVLSISVAQAAVPDFFNLKKEPEVKIEKEYKQSRVYSKSVDVVTEESDKKITQELEAKSVATSTGFEDLDAQQILLKKMKDKKKFNLKTKSLFVDKKVKFVKLTIPIHQMSEIFVDKKIVKLDFINNEKVTITLDQEEAQKITIINKDLNLDHNIKITFFDGSTIRLLLSMGNAISERHIEYKLYFEKKKIALLPEFQKKLKVRDVHTYFNNVSTKLIIDKILQKDSFVSIEENKKKINQVLFDGEAVFDSITGKEVQNYKINLDFVYETPFVKDTKRDEVKKRLIMLEMTVTNQGLDNTLIVSPEFIKLRFGTFVAFYVGDLDTEQDHVGPKQSLRILVVIEDKVKEEELK